jgi:hypothetical protein
MSKELLPQVSRLEAPVLSSINDSIGSIADADRQREEDLDEYEGWKRYELTWAQEQYDESVNPVTYWYDEGVNPVSYWYDEGVNPVTYWYELCQKYAELLRSALDILTILALRCDVSVC